MGYLIPAIGRAEAVKQDSRPTNLQQQYTPREVDRNATRGGGRSMSTGRDSRVHELCAHIHLEGAATPD